MSARRPLLEAGAPPHLCCCSASCRYNEAKDLAKNLEKQASKVQAEAQEAGDKALRIFANLTSLPPFNTDALEVAARCFTGVGWSGD